jgi:lysine 2,3-aminomutase
MRALRGRLSGLGIPQYVVDLPGGGGKVPMTPDYREKVEDDGIDFHNYLGDYFHLPQPE